MHVHHNDRNYTSVPKIELMLENSVPISKLNNTDVITSLNTESKVSVPAWTSQRAVMSAPVTMPYSCSFPSMSHVMQVYDLSVY
jgi:type III secretory pathway lipoprotein EscJ